MLDVPAGVTQEEGHTGFFIHLLSAVRAFIFFARRIQPFLSLVDREVEFVDGIDSENIPSEKIAAAVAVGASVFELWSTVPISVIAVVWSG